MNLPLVGMRAWDPSRRQMLYVKDAWEQEVHISGSHDCTFKVDVFMELPHLNSSREYQEDPCPNVTELVWMRPTGLKDVNGAEIYEGDILKDGKQGHLRAVKWGDIANDHPDEDFVLGVGFELFDPYDKPESYEVIGNIYENSELVERAA